MKIYRVFCTETNKNYIGVTSLSLKAEMVKHEYEAVMRNDSGKPAIAFHADFLKFGKKAFKLCVLVENIEKSKVNSVKKEMVEKYNSLFPNGYNKPKELSTEAKQSLSDKMAAKWSATPPEARKASEITKSKQSAAKLESHPRAKPLMFRGIEYKSLRQAEKATGIPMYSIKKEIPEDYEVGNHFKSRSKLAEYLMLSEADLDSFLAKNSLADFSSLE